jgi:uncharacterized protein YyaL (SSP411 family)
MGVTALVVAGFGIRLATRLLPERQPNRLEAEYGAYTNLGARHRINWYPFDGLPFRIARDRNQLVFIEVGDVFSPPSHVYTYRHFEDPDIIRVLNSHYVSIRIDQQELPAIASAISINTLALFEASGSWLLLLDPNGDLLAQSPYRSLTSEQNRPGMERWLMEQVSIWSRGKETLLAEKQTMSDRRKLTLANSERIGAITKEIANAYLTQLTQAVSSERGAFDVGVSPIASPIPQLMLESNDDHIVYLAKRWLQELRMSACYDQIGGGFFMMARSPYWKSPSFGKPTEISALLAAVYAQTGMHTNDVLLIETAKQTVKWLLSMRDPVSGLFWVGIGTDEIREGRSPYYDWMFDSLPNNAQTIFKIENNAPHGPLTLTSTQVVFAQDYDETINKLLRERNKRTQPIVDKALYANINGKVISSLFRIGRTLNDDSLIEIADTAIESVVQTFIQKTGDVLHAETGLGRTTGQFADSVWIVRALIEAFLSTGNKRRLELAELIQQRSIEVFGHANGGFVAYLPSTLNNLPFALTIRNIADMPQESENATAIRNLYDLSVLTKNERYFELFVKTTSAFGESLSYLGATAASYVREVLRSYRKVVLLSGKRATDMLRNIEKTSPGVPCYIATEVWQSNLKSGDGVYEIAPRSTQIPWVEHSVTYLGGD